MKIGNPLEKAIGAGAAQRTEGATTTSTPGKTGSLDGGVSESAKVTLSSTATGLMNTADNGDFNAAKVSEVKSAIDNGTYKVNAEVIADKLISNARDLLQARAA
ncbi:flagellar biosynthesis anti-sigma factor FlgM [uncultured Aquabacterium sp.]|uniref:flagellar biosynthesis anti-sigma factor FlgM n=1 Tax=Aquabacterium sp. TaxID=1872578 RepID=UPI0025CC82B1|nr:flagellar biosynthesis anti-sigma factor FlgM [uncultured Aquabacterium sp.]